MTVIDRFIAAINHLGYNKNRAVFARKTGIPRARLSKTEKNNTMPSLETISSVAKIFPNAINWHWVLTEKGNMLPNAINVHNNGNIGDIVGANKTSTMVADFDFLREELETKNKLIEKLQESNQKLSEKVTTLLEDKINYLQEKK